MLPPELDSVIESAIEQRNVLAPVMSVVFAYILYALLGRRYLGPDDDYWETARYYVLPVLDRIGRRYGFHAKRTSRSREYVGSTEIDAEEFEQRLADAGYLRQPVAVLHTSEDGRKERGSWVRFSGPLHPIERILKGRIRTGLLPIEVVHALNTICALKQIHVVFYVREKSGDEIVDVYAHREYNPLNPLVVLQHYAGIGRKTASGVVRTGLSDVGVELEDRRRTTFYADEQD